MYVDCEVCGERYSRSESEVRQWITEIMMLDKTGVEETISQCVSCVFECNLESLKRKTDAVRDKFRKLEDE